MLSVIYYQTHSLSTPQNVEHNIHVQDGEREREKERQSNDMEEDCSKIASLYLIYKDDKIRISMSTLWFRFGGRHLRVPLSGTFLALHLQVKIYAHRLQIKSLLSTN